MDAELLALCNQVMIVYSYVGYNEDNDFTWQNDVTAQDVILTDMVPTLLHANLVVGSVVVQDKELVPTVFDIDIDYTVDNTLGTLTRTLGSSIPSGVEISVDYSWRTVSVVNCRIEYYNKLIRDKDGQETVSTCQIYCDYNSMSEKDKIILSGTSRIDPEILSIQYNPDEFGEIDHMVIYTR